MKAVSINVSLNSDLADFARGDAEAGAFDSVSEYVRELIRRRREARIAEDVALLDKAITNAPAGDPSDTEMRRIYTVARAARKK